ncbi:hypothetical protein PRIPAC_83710 [Pristionchus pacificus]|uniref:Uncharacterized protein n=1 Tax=Pristionchus pacificus TaxID=54126 RepID=A0A2A6BTR4_PRIPA|nr:hypothetical protein PRIPAC_83710 [Pristionchus pacificus]|eukprot:PDM69151.1 hypothetical protein PRIPAC_47453 [Pristionchus pacificus]
MRLFIRTCILFLAFVFIVDANSPSCPPKIKNKHNGDMMASLIKTELKRRNLKVFLDVNEVLCTVGFVKVLDEAVMASNNFIPLLTNYSIRPEKPGQIDYMHREIRLAFEHNKNIIPVSDKSFNIEDLNDRSIPEDMRKLLNYDIIEWSHKYQNAVVEKIVRYIKKGNKQAKSNKSSRPSVASVAVQTDDNVTPNPSIRTIDPSIGSKKVYQEYRFRQAPPIRKTRLCRIVVNSDASSEKKKFSSIVIHIDDEPSAKQYRKCIIACGPHYIPRSQSEIDKCKKECDEWLSASVEYPPTFKYRSGAIAVKLLKDPNLLT